MKIVELIRLEESAHGTIGVLKINKEIFCFTLEPPDRLNERSRSSIPAKQYLCKPFESQRFGRTFEVADVPGRSAILFHAGNTVEHTEGCILVGESVGKLIGNRAVLNSGATFKRFAESVGAGQTFSLTITEHY